MADLPSIDWLAAITRFDPPSRLEAPPDWDAAVQLLARHGLGPLAAYNLNFRMPLTDTPEYARDLLFGYFQGTSQDNVFKFVNLKTTLGDLEGARIVLLGGAGLAEGIYPHIAFRPIPELDLLIEAQDRARVTEALAEERFLPFEPEEPDPEEPAAVFFNDRFFVRLFTSPLPNEREVPGLFARALPFQAYGASIYRLAAEDALLVHVLSLAKRGFVVPLIHMVDLREMVKGDSPLAFRGGPGAPIERDLLLARAKLFGAERALWAAMELLAWFHPEVAERARSLQPDLGFATRKLLAAAVVDPARDITRERQLKAVEKLQQLLLG